MAFLVALLLVLGVAYRASTSEQRARLLRALLVAARRQKDTAVRSHLQDQPYRDALRARTPWALVTPALVALNATIFFLMPGGGAPGDPQTLVGWGGSFGPRTTNGEWWRLVTSMFIHTGVLHLFVNVIGLIQVGVILERLLGRLAFAGVYVAAGVVASLMSLSAHPVAVSVGASGAIFGVYGLLLASSIWGMLYRSSLTIPMTAAKELGPAAAVFIVYNLTNDRLGSAAELSGLAAGFVCGLVLGKGVSERKPSARWVGATMAATAVIAVASAVSLRGVADVKPEIERVLAVEDRTANAYQAAADRFRKGRMTAETLAQLIDRTIMPELQAADARLKALDGVPHELQPLVDGAEEYLRLRYESWRLRSEGLRKTNSPPLQAELAPDEKRLRVEARHKASLMALGKAEGAERASLEALKKIRPASPR